MLGNQRVRRQVQRFAMLLISVAVFSASASSALAETEMPEQYRSLQQLQRDVMRRAPEEQERLQPKIRQAEQQACAVLRQEQLKGVPLERYQQEGGPELSGFVQQFDHYCKTIE